MEDSMEEEPKQFDAVHGVNDEDSQPDPDEPLLSPTDGYGRVWVVKIPKFLLERWSNIDEEGIELATIRVYNEAKSSSGKKPRIVLLLPPTEENPGGDEYELDMVNDAVENQIVVAEREKEPGSASRARTTMLTGIVQHECNLRPVFSDRYRRRLKERTIAANRPARQIMRIEDAHPGGRGGINMLTSGMAHTTPFNIVKGKPKPAKGQFERMARMPRNQLLDELFRAFQEREHWPIKVLRDRTQQPEAYLKEVLSEIAFLHRSGEHNGSWELLANYKGEGIKAENVPGPSYAPAYGNGVPGVEMEEMKLEGEDDDDDDEDEDDDDMEEVS
ncbi:Transcription initiation factor IIF subunit beta [Sparassis crispa]|uniref:Transcription initiation factor IIF subunit beta n=1 Tax=Sparassis crispa TaxID=139825 RepID=A0A401H0Y3_9APHY|nr:Transcription initiation factor IIF subunit beta [Sparassis crispa]GBE88062.1 Transcription initiation factor IIF subunit beta [Sparassis crispa]